MKNFLSLLLISILIFSCSTANDSDSASGYHIDTESFTQEFVDPLPDIKPGPTTFTINVQEEHVLTTELGSTITIPKDAFVDEDGNPVEGEVKISFQEYHSASDVILSGIPMHIVSENGELEAFETAGMFEIKGQDEGGNEIRVAADKTLAIELASFKEDNDFNFYALDEEKGTWTELSKNTQAVNNQARSSVELELGPEPTPPVQIQKANSTDFVFDLAVDSKLNPEFSTFDNVLWKLEDEKSVNKELFKNTISNPKLECVDRAKSTYLLTGMSKAKNVNARVQPVLFGSNWRKAQAKFNAKFGEYQAKIERRKKRENEMLRMAKFQRNLSISNFGIFNCDRFSRMKEQKKVRFSAVFLLPALKKTIDNAFLIIKKGLNREAVPVSGLSASNFIYSPDENNTLITFDEDGNVYEFTNARFEEITSMNLRPTDEYSFKLKTTGVNIANQDDLDDYLDQL